jgi:hypothetical protein
MRLSYRVMPVLLLLGACAHQSEVSSTTVTRWESRDVSELVAAIGPFDTTSIQGDSRSYYWYRFGNCHVTANTSRDDKILKIDVRGTTQGCTTYLEKMGNSEAPAAKR